jgi:hypothetical protein
MSANPAILPSAYIGPELVPFVCEAPALAKETDRVSVSSAENAKLAKGFLSAIDLEVTAIDFEVASALSLCVGWKAQNLSDVYLIRTLQRIAEHMKALQVIQATLNQSREANSHAELHVVSRGN